MRVLAVPLLLLPLCAQAVTTDVEVVKEFSFSADEVKLNALREARVKALEDLPKLIVQEEHLENDEYMAKVSGITPGFIKVVSTAEHIDVIRKRYILKATFELNEHMALEAIKAIRDASDAKVKLERMYRSLDSAAGNLTFKSPQSWQSELKSLSVTSDSFLRDSPERTEESKLRFIERVASQVGAATLPDYLASTTSKLLSETDAGFKLQIVLPANYSSVVRKPLQEIMAKKTGLSNPDVNYVYPCLVEYVADFVGGNLSVAGLYDLSDPFALASSPSKYTRMWVSVVEAKIVLIAEFYRLPVEIRPAYGPIPASRSESFRHVTESLDRYIKIKPCFKTHEAFRLYNKSVF